MNSKKFMESLQSKKIENGTKFKVYDENTEYIGTVGVIDTTVVYMEMPIVPNDLLTGNYTFEKINN